ncbi:Calx-beta domain-containing protein [Candidatus Halobeggiatoa sp. HSG11]|nr:Calx-beta domain-containing protein [Candidatus Halobeggiatoa sp. HSG11]
MKTRIPILLLAIPLGCLTRTAFAVYDLSWNTVDGGGERSTGGTYTLEGTVGQHDAGAVNGGTYDLNGGFWQAEDVKIISIDDPTAVTEGDTGTIDIDFTVSLDAADSQAIKVDYTTADDTATTAGSDYTAITTTTLTFAAGETSKTVTVTINGDEIDEGASEALTVNLTNPTGNAQLSTVAGETEGIGTITDDDTAGFTLSKTTASVNESGTTDTFTVVLDTKPTSNVEISVTSGDTAEATVSATPALPLTFTPANWNIAQTVTITGADETAIDGDQITTVTVSIVDLNSDDTYDPLADQTVSVTTVDDDTPGFTITPTSGLTTTEAGGTATFTVVLNTAPTATVTLPLVSSDTTEGTVSPVSLDFTTTDWSSAQTVTITGVDDTAVDGNVNYTIQTNAATSADGNYSGINPSDVTVTNQDNDVAPTDTGGSTSTPLPDKMTVFTKFGGLGSGTISSSPSGINCKTVDEECSAKFDTASHVELTAKADSGSIFDRWNNADCSTKMFLTSSRNCIAYFKLTPRTLTVEYPENGVITSSPTGINCGNGNDICSYEFEGGANINLTTTPNSGYALDPTAENCSDGKVQLLENTTCSVTFKPGSTDSDPTDTGSDPTGTDSNPTGTGSNPTGTDSDPTDTGSNSSTDTSSDSTNTDSDSTTNTITFSEQSYRVFENAGQIQIIVTRVGTKGKVTVELRSSVEQASLYQPVVETLVWNDGEDGDIVVPITLIDNDKANDNKEIILSLGDVTNAEFYGLNTVILTIIDDESTPNPNVPVDKVNNDSTNVIGNNTCPRGHVINTTCNYGWNNAKDILIEEKGNIGYANIVSDIENNQGRISNSKIFEDVQVTGGILSGYISNLGILADFEFLGGSINGANEAGEVVGTLAGYITNDSEVEGFFENVRLAPGTRIIGGTLSGHIIGDSEQPATLENLLIKSNAVISNVILGGNVEWEDGVVFGENIGFSIHMNYMETHNITMLPNLIGIAAINKYGNSISTWASLQGGSRFGIKGERYKKRRTFKRSKQQKVDVLANVLTDMKHIGQKADILVVAAYTPIGATSPTFYMLDSNGTPLLWDGAMSSLVPFQANVTMDPVVPVSIWNNPLDILGDVQVYFGYRLVKTSEIIYTLEDMIEMDFIE